MVIHMENDKMRTAIIDIGSNTIRLVVYDFSDELGLREIDNIKVVARLRNYLQVDGNMSVEGIQLLAKNLRMFKQIIDDYQVADVQAFATAAVRQANNHEHILQMMYKEVGLEITLLSEDEEAFFGFIGVAYTMKTPSAITIDIGGGSTEITCYERKELVHSISFPVGTVSLKQQFVKNNRMTSKEKTALNQYIKEQLEQVEWLKDCKLPVIGIGGSARNIGQVHQNRTNYPATGIHQYELSHEAFDDVKEYIERLSFDELQQLDGLSSDRADIIEIAIEVFSALMTVVQAPSFQISKKGLREGTMIHRILEIEPLAFHKQDIYTNVAKRFIREFGRTELQASDLVMLATSMYIESCSIGLFEQSDQDINMIKRAATVYAIGEYIELDEYSPHTFHLIANQSLIGLTHKERIQLALIASYKNKDTFYRQMAPFETWFTKEESKKMKDFGALLKFIYALYVSKRKVVNRLVLTEANGELIINIFTNTSALAEIYQANKRKKHIEKMAKMPVRLYFIEEG